MSGFYPDGLNQAGFDAYWSDKLDDREEDDFSWEDEDLYEYWKERSELWR